MATLRGRHRGAAFVFGLLCVVVLAWKSRLSAPVIAQASPPVVKITVNASDPGREIPSTLFGLFFEEINHAGAGGLWAELVQNRGFEAGGQNTPSLLDPWYKVGTHAQVTLRTERCSPLDRNPVALKVEVLCNKEDNHNQCPEGGVGAANPGFWGMVRAFEPF